MATENRYEFLKKLGVGFDTVLSVVDKLGAAYFSEDYPPFNLVKTDAETYVVQVSMVGYEKEQIDAIHEGGILTIRAAGSGKTDDAADDIYFHHGIKDGDNYIKFPISPGLRFEGAVFENNILYVTYKVRKEDEPPLADGKVQILDEIEAEELKVLSHSGRVKFDKSGKARLRKQRMGFRKYAYDSSGRPVAVMDLEDENKVDEEETEKLLSSLGSEKSKEVIEEVKAKVEEKKAEAEAKHEEVKAEVAAKVEEIHEKIEEKKAEKAEEKAEKKAEKAEAKAEKKEDEVTVEVGAPENKPQVVEAKVNKKSDTEVSVIISDATVEVSDEVVLEKVETKPGKADVVVAVKEEDKKILEEAKIDLKETVKEVVETLDSAPKLPEKTEKSEETKTVLIDKEAEDKPTVEVTVPKEVTSVVAVVKDEAPSSPDVPAIKVEDTSEKISDTAELVPVVTPAGKPDIVAAIEPEVKEEIEAAGGDVKEVVEKAIAVVVEDVVTAEPVEEKAVEVASEAEPVKAVEEAAKEVKTELVDKEAEDKPTVEVTVDTADSPQVVAVKLDETPTNADVPAIVVEDATVEVTDTAELVVAKTEEGKSDVVVAIEPEVKEALEDAGVVVEEVVAKALETTDSVPEVPVVEEELVEPVTVMVDKTDAEKSTVEVTVPDVVPQVVVAEIKEAPVGEDLAIELKPVEDAIPEDAEVVAVVTPEGNPDMVVAITPEVKAEAEVAGVANTTEVIEKAVNQADVTVVTTDSTTVDEEKVAEASAVEEVVEKLDVIAKEPATLVLNEKDETQPTVEVTLAAEDAPQIVEVKLDETPSSPDVPAIVVEDATMAVKSETAELIPVTTEEGKSDVVIAIEPEVKAELEAKDVVVEEVVADALEVNDAVPTLPEETAVAPIKEVEVKSETSDAAVTVEVPEVISQVVEVSKEGDKVSLNDTSAEIAPEAELEVVETPEGLPNIVAVTTPEVKEELLKEVDLEPTEVVAKAIEEAKPMVETVVDAPIEVDVSNVEVKTVSSNVTTKPVVIVKKPSE